MEPHHRHNGEWWINNNGEGCMIPHHRDIWYHITDNGKWLLYHITEVIVGGKIPYHKDRNVIPHQTDNIECQTPER